MRPAIPFVISLSPRETEAPLIPCEELLSRLKVAFPEAEFDRDRGRSEVLQHMQELLDKGTPEIIVQGLPGLAEQTCYVAVQWPNWPCQSVTGHVSRLQRELEGLYFRSQQHDFEFIRFAARQLATAFNMHLNLRTHNYEAVETEAWPRDLEPHEWIKARYADLDPHQHPVLRVIADWPIRLQRGVCRYLEEYDRCIVNEMTQGFETFDDYATAYVKEVEAFSRVRNCWWIDIQQPHHNEVLIDHGEWLTRINLGGVETELFETEM